MIDRNNLNRIKGILSAKQGAEIPKFQEGAKFARYNGTKMIYSLDGSSWYEDMDLKTPYSGSLSGFRATQIPMKIPGDLNITPDTAVERSAQIVSGVALEEDKNTIQEQANVVSGVPLETPKAETVTLSQTSMNSAPVASVHSVGPVKNTGLISNGLRISEEEVKNKIRDTKIINNVSSIASAAFEGIGTAIGAKQLATDSNLTKGIDTVYDGAAAVASQFGPIGQAVGSIMKIAGTAGDIIQELGGGTDQQTKMDKWMDSSFFSWNIGMLNGFAGKNTQNFGADQDILATIGSSYGGTTNDILDASEKAGKKYGLFSSKARKKADAAINTARSQQTLMGGIADTATDQRLAAQSMGEQAGLAYALMTDGGYNQKYTYAAKHGGLLEWNPVIEWEPQVELNWELPTFKKGGNIELVEELEWIPEFKSGGKTEESDIPETEETTQKNVIPEGALHKNRHHMEHAEGLTKKGIPVIDDDREQQAEIEHSEIIFTLEVTKKLEEYYEIFYSDESSNKEKEQAALDAGKLLVYQILENTEDRTGLIDSCKQGGSLTLKKSTEELIEEALEWMPTIVVVEESKKVNKEDSEKEKIKEVLKEVLIELLVK